MYKEELISQVKKDLTKNNIKFDSVDYISRYVYIEIGIGHRFYGIDDNENYFFISKKNNDLEDDHYDSYIIDEINETLKRLRALNLYKYLIE